MFRMKDYFISPPRLECSSEVHEKSGMPMTLTVIHSDRQMAEIGITEQLAKDVLEDWRKTQKLSVALFSENDPLTPGILYINEEGTCVVDYKPRDIIQRLTDRNSVLEAQVSVLRTELKRIHGSLEHIVLGLDALAQAEQKQGGK